MMIPFAVLDSRFSVAADHVLELRTRTVNYIRAEHA